MFFRISEHVTSEFERLNIITSDDREIYRYGVQIGLNLLLNLLTTVVIGILCGMFWESVVYIVAYMPLRRYAGGFHAKTHIRCYIYSVIMIILTLLTMKVLTFDFWFYAALMSMGCGLILWLAPVEDKNKPLDALEQKVYRKKNCLLVAFEALLFLMAVILHVRVVYCTIAMAMFSLSILVVVGQINNQSLKKMECE